MDKLLEEPKQAWVENLLNLWGAWAFSGLDRTKRMNMLAKLMLQVDPNAVTEPQREMCDDELGLVISTVLSYYIKNPCPQDFKYLEAKYVYGCSVYAIAKYQWQKDKSVKFNTWRSRVKKSIQDSEWVVAKYLDLALKNHKQVGKLQKFVFKM